MRPLKVCSENKVKIESIIDDVQKNSVIRLINHSDIIRAKLFLEKRLSLFLYKKDWHGLTFGFDPNFQTFPRAYNGNPESTHFVIESKKSGFFVTDIYRTYTREFYCLPLQAMETKSAEIITFLNNAKNW